MKHEFSYGAVVYRIKDGIVYYLVEHMTLGHTSLPKGHIEEGETPYECALREIKEETNLDVDLNTSFRRTITYTSIGGVEKDVTFYLATPKEKEAEVLVPQLCEVQNLEWLDFEHALEVITHDTDKGVLRQANDYILRIDRRQ